jgi:hypothetical protein
LLGFVIGGLSEILDDAYSSGLMLGGQACLSDALPTTRSSVGSTRPGPGAVRTMR